MFYCPRIKNGLVFTANGDYDVCASRNLANTSKLAVDQFSPQDFLNSEFRTQLLDTMSSGIWPKGCEKCLWMESLKLTSVRQNALKSPTARRIHIHATNVCDSDCVMCGPRWSTTIAKRLVKHPDPTESFFFSGTDAQHLWDNPKSVEHLTSAIDQYDELHFVGGEPFLDKKMWKFIQNNPHKNKTLSFVTNGNTALTDRQLATLNEYNVVNVAVSADGTDLTYEWIRQNLSWKVLLKNILRMKQNGLNVSIVAVIQAHNVQNIPKLEHIGVPVHFDILTSPSILNPVNAPRWVLQQARDELSVNSLLTTYFETFLKSSPLHSLDDLIKHTNYLNGHRTHHFDANTWQVQKKSCAS